MAQPNLTPRLTLRQQLEHALFNPVRTWQWIVYWTIIALIFASVLELAILAQYPEVHAGRHDWFWIFNVAVLGIFGLEILLRIIARPRPKDYLFTWQGLVDLLAIIPAAITLVGPVPLSVADSLWLRTLRVIRLLRVAKLLQHVRRVQNEHLAVLARLAPYFAMGVALKATILYLEGLGYWPEIDGLETVITIIGFAIGILLSTRLGTVHDRIYSFDARVQGMLGSVEAARPYVSSDKILLDWVEDIAAVVMSGGERSGFEEANEKLARGEGDQIPADIYNSMHRDAQFLVHRVRTRTPRVYTRLLSRLTVMYIVVVIATIPGLTGLVSSLLVIYVLGGMTMIVEFMDKPFDPSEDSLINSDMSGLEVYLSYHGRSLGAPSGDDAAPSEPDEAPAERREPEPA